MLPKLHVAKLGEGLAVRIPKPVAEQLGIHEGSAVEIVPSGDRVVIRRENPSLDDLLARITEDNLHAEQDTGSPQGNEQW